MFFPSEVNPGKKRYHQRGKNKTREERSKGGGISILLRAKGQVIKQEKHVMDFRSP